ncbi:DUF962 domain-containing protein [Legionella sp. D16C41]|uniref:Mpo1 family 2-hydroxy fatty acid dioxygenase n=1 Tax=Legionella sp. D16C41 TaxID=3402688 RepID=UPI003AF71863
MKSFVEQAQFYAKYHQEPVTFYTHLIGVPLIIFSLMIFLGFFHIVVPGVINIGFADIFTVIALLYYLFLNWRLGLILIPIFTFMVWIADLISWAGPTKRALWAFLILFILGWAFQLIGHFIEGRRPALINNFWQALIAPMYLMAEIFFRMGRMEALRKQIHPENDMPLIVNTPNQSNDISQD